MTSTKVWQFEMTKEAEKAFSRLDKIIKQRIINFFEDRVLPAKDPRLLGKPLIGKLEGYWSYRIGDYRVLTDIQDSRFIILVIDVGHRREIYNQ